VDLHKQGHHIPGFRSNQASFVSYLQIRTDSIAPEIMVHGADTPHCFRSFRSPPSKNLQE
jgi:hypothetical protein